MGEQVSPAVVAGREKPDVWGCVKCAQLGKTCCQQREIFVTAGDRERIAVHTGIRDFWEYRAPADPSYLDQDDDPVWLQSVFLPDGTRPVLTRKENGDCRFLGPAGCELPLEVRPLVCRLYPYEYTAVGIVGVSGDCPSQVVPPGSTILQVLNMRAADAVRWHRILYAELRAGKESFHDSGTHIRSAG
ncbi:MAG TPA: YkgJ family cysteine cluster protein [Phycisphaerae bacterium]|nr:YkgJ family cysteine cluster protein [Phycisphaerae bacterium]HOM52635.1 YkgJ family cysteine cluster protein [Phycisphaerae bacterium]HOQ87150.1 YkgJ family cysteine cluster protein [Phycisphaerae bacterium]HPP27909.1 YkgJ family cysteine cluster protein [Phycisphaerae bacterium]HPU25814.1 YkgJ family cysteine cluster protein [Phycisphaerae bacterium]